MIIGSDQYVLPQTGGADLSDLLQVYYVENINSGSADDDDQALHQVTSTGLGTLGRRSGVLVLTAVCVSGESV